MVLLTVRTQCRTENVVDRASVHDRPLKLRLELISVPVLSANFRTRLYDILGSIMSSINAHLGRFLGRQASVIGLKVDMIRN